MTLRAEDGTPLIPKEAIVLDEEGNTIATPHDETRRTNEGLNNKIRMFKLSGWLAPLLAIAIVTVLAMGTFFFIAGLVIVLIITFIRFLFKSFTT
jgi:hypothetical protein